MIFADFSLVILKNLSNYSFDLATEIFPICLVVRRCNQPELEVQQCRYAVYLLYLFYGATMTDWVPKASTCRAYRRPYSYIKQPDFDHR